MPSWSAGPATSSSGYASGPKAQETGWPGSSEPLLIFSLIGAFCMRMAEHREPYDSRGSRTVLGARGGEIPSRDSPGRAQDRRCEALAVARRRPDRDCARVLVQRRRDKQAAKRLLRKLLKKQMRPPRVMITDKLASYGAAKREVMPGIEHRQHKGLNNRAENSHQPTRRRERQMSGSNRPARRSASSRPTIRSTTCSTSAAITSLPPSTELPGSKASTSGRKSAALGSGRSSDIFPVGPNPT